MDFLYPQIAELIDWQQPVEFLDKELQKITRKAKNSRRFSQHILKTSSNRIAGKERQVNFDARRLLVFIGLWGSSHFPCCIFLRKNRLVSVWSQS